jgi:hypothetical protein
MAGTPQRRARREAGIVLAGDKPPQGYDFLPRINQMPNVERVLAGQPMTSDQLRHARDLADSIVASLVADARPELVAAITRGMADPDDNAALNGAKLAFGVLDRAKRIDIADTQPSEAEVVATEYVDSE